MADLLVEAVQSRIQILNELRPDSLPATIRWPKSWKTLGTRNAILPKVCALSR